MSNHIIPDKYMSEDLKERIEYYENKDVHKKGKCEFCKSGKPLVIGRTNDQGIAIQHPNILNAYGYDIHGFGSNGISVKINYCPMCGAKMEIRE